MTKQTTATRVDLTFKHNIQLGKHGWLRLTPAYSVKLVTQILDEVGGFRHVLDPFCGTGTTALVCGERGINCDSLDINDFLVWFARVKTTTCSANQVNSARALFGDISARVEQRNADGLWLPPIRDIDRWWSPNTAITLAKLIEVIQAIYDDSVKDLYRVAFCQTLINASNAAFNHQSMSFKQPQATLFDLNHTDLLLADFQRALERVLRVCQQPIPGQVSIIQADARRVPESPGGAYDCVITSPPYPNRMSYIRELRPYMYWLGYLAEPRQAGELDWQAIGGTWGIATSRVSKWQPPDRAIPHEGFDDLIARIAKHSDTLARYVHKYFLDMLHHFESLVPHLASGARLFYVVGNSKFYDVVVPVEHIYADLLSTVGLTGATVTPIRKRNSKKELYEYLVEAKKR